MTDFILEKYILQTPSVVIPENCQLSKISITQDLSKFEESQEQEIEEDLVKFLKHQKSIQILSIKKISLSKIFFENIKVFKEFNINTCCLKNIPPFQNSSFLEIIKFHISNCSFENMEDIKTLLDNLKNVDVLETLMITCKNYNEGIVRVEMPNLRHWNISHCRGISWVLAPKLQILSTNGVKFENGQNYKSFFKTSPNLKSFYCRDFFETDVMNLVSSMENLEHFEILFDTFQFEILEYILRNFKNVKKGKVGFHNYSIEEEDFGRIEEICLNTGFRFFIDDFDNISIRKDDGSVIYVHNWEYTIDEEDFY